MDPTKTKVLIVEDEVLIAMQLEMDLAELGYEVCPPAMSGEEAIASVKTEQPDIVIMDIHLKGTIDGLAAAGEISRVYRIPIIFLSGYCHNELMKQTERLSPVACLTKPVQSYDLAAAIRSALSQND
ncbi:MAG: response regulator [Chloroflexota bacterium]